MSRGVGAFWLRTEMKMFWVESSLRRLKDNVDHFVIPSIALRNVSMLEAQIEFRRQALREIEVIRCHLRPFMRRESKSLQRRYRSPRR
jgi:hypothetical protein